MRVSLNWLKEFVDITVSPDDLAHLLTMSGLEVEQREPLGHSLVGVLAARILSVKLHPHADHLFICQVDTGKKEVQVVCSSSNLKEGAMVPIALPGTVLPGGMKVEQSLIRGESSEGMLLAEDEMGLTDDHTGIMILPSEVKQGTPITNALPVEDWVIEIALTPNRPDCASVMGIAREIAALTGKKLRRPETEIEEGEKAIEDLTSVTIVDPDGCPRYAAGMILNVSLKPSPFWMRYRLYISGVRSINNVVDVTNYVLLEMGQPLHAFDYDRLSENRIVVSRAQEGEPFTTLDGKTYTLTSENLMICDGKRSVALAGVMGGLNSEIFAGSRNVLIESAYFDPRTIRRGAKRLGICTEASYRFERGVDIEGIPTALRRAMMLISRLAAGEVIRGIIDNYLKPRRPLVIDLNVGKANRFLGTNLSSQTVARYLSSLEMDVDAVDDHVIRVIPPSFRIDLTRDWDLMEELARLEGYDNIPVTIPPIRPSEEKDDPRFVLGDRIRETMIALGFTEFISYSFISADSADLIDAEEESDLRSFVNLMNPLTIEQSVMRTSLVPGLMAALKINFSYGEKDLRLFEWGKVFIRRISDELPIERYSLCGLITGLANPKEWYREERTADFYDIKGAVETFLGALGLQDSQFRVGKVPPWYHKEISCEISLGDSKGGSIGQVSREVLRRFDLDTESVYLFELDGALLMEKMRGEKRFRPLAKFPAVFRDMSIVVKRETESASIREIIKREGGDLVESVILFDLYEGGKIASSEKALAFRICYRSEEATLDGREVNRLHEAIIARIGKETGGRLRDG
jgi:phenylalanyl-tRNA synthetase beta chain